MAGGHAPTNARQVQGARVLLVEDAGLIAMWVQSTLEAAGLDVLGPATRVEQALQLAECETFDVAFLDIDLNGELVWPVADALLARGIPFAFTTGFESVIAVPDRFSANATLAKPYREEELVHAVRRLLEGDS